MPPVAISTGGDLEARAAFNHYLRTGEIRDGNNATGLMVSSSTKGAALAPDDFAKEIIDGLNNEVVMRQLARSCRLFLVNLLSTPGALEAAARHGVRRPHYSV